MANNCKVKGCNNEALNGGKYCNCHKAEKEDRNRVIGTGAMTIFGIVVTVICKKFLNGSDKS